MQRLKLLDIGDVLDGYFHAVGVHHIYASFSRVILHLLIDHDNRRLAFCDSASKFSIFLDAADFFKVGAPLELWIWNFNWPMLRAITIHVEVSK